MSPGSAKEYRWATIMGLSVAGERGLKGGGEESRLLSEGGVKCVNMSGQHRWATIMGESVAR